MDDKVGLAFLPVYVYVCLVGPIFVGPRPGAVNPALRFANLIWWYFLVVATQWLYKFLIGER